MFSTKLPVLVLAASTVLLMAAAPAGAQMSHGTMQHGAMQHGGAKPAEAPSTKAFQDAARRMHRDMAIDYSGDADVDFVRGMIPHHQAAIDMAKIELQYGKDAQTRALAEAIIKAQEAEIADMRAWLKARGQ
jgi:uncharacterized protein (DUF305 family)